jgi:hypothetical protein
MSLEVGLSDPKRGPVCGCINALRPSLREANAIIGVSNASGAAIVFCRRIDADGPKPPFLIASFCPFCGEEYQ